MATKRQKLLKIAKEKGTIRAFVAKEALGRGSGYIETFFRDLANYGCVSGMVKSLIYYSNTHKFFDKYYYEIIDLLRDIEDKGTHVVLGGDDIKNKLSWICFEHVAYNIATEDLGLFQ